MRNDAFKWYNNDKMKFIEIILLIVSSALFEMQFIFMGWVISLMHLHLHYIFYIVDNIVVYHE